MSNNSELKNIHTLEKLGFWWFRIRKKRFYQAFYRCGICVRIFPQSRVSTDGRTNQTNISFPLFWHEYTRYLSLEIVIVRRDQNRHEEKIINLYALITNEKQRGTSSVPSMFCIFFIFFFNIRQEHWFWKSADCTGDRQTP